MTGVQTCALPISTAREREVAKVARRSIAAARPIEAGCEIVAEDIVFLRPGTGIAPADVNLVLGRKLKRPLDRGALIVLTDLG